MKERHATTSNVIRFITPQLPSKGLQGLEKIQQQLADLTMRHFFSVQVVLAMSTEVFVKRNLYIAD